jgi:AraC-like DNA-binding protein
LLVEQALANTPHLAVFIKIGESIPSFLKNRRMNKAAEYLEKSSQQVTDIAFMMGYENASKFAAVFKAVKGESPLEYRRRYKSYS